MARERAVVPPAAFESYYDRPIIKEAPWKSPDVPLYFFLGGLAGASSVLAAAADLTRRPTLAGVSRVTATVAMLGSAGALIHDLGRPARFLNMLRVFKPTSPMSMGTWTMVGYGPLTGVAAASHVTGIAPRTGRVAGVAAACLGPMMWTYTAALLADTAVPAWHEAHRELPFVFGGSALASGAGMALIVAPPAETGPARRMALAGAGMDVAAVEVMRRLGLVAEPYGKGRAGMLMRTAEGLTAAGGVAAVLARGSRVASVLAGSLLLAGSLTMRFGVYEAGLQSARDPKYTVIPQRARLDARGVVQDELVSSGSDLAEGQ